MNKKDKIHSLVFITLASLICFVPALWIALSSLNIIPQNTLNLGNTELPKVYSFLPNYQNFFERIRVGIHNQAVKQFPLHTEILETFSETKQKINRLLYNTFLKNSQFVPLSNNVFAHIDDEFLFAKPNLENYSLKLDTTASAVNSMAKNNPHINFNYYAITPIYQALSTNSNSYLVPSPDYTAMAAELLDINSGFLEYNQKYFYNSDHHLNYHGAYKSYLDIIKLLKADNEPLEYGYDRFAEDYTFYGSRARSSAYDSVNDKVYDGNIDVPPYSVFINGTENSTAFPQKIDYFNKTAEESKYKNHYAAFFHTDYALLKFEFNNNSNRNLLIIADSISNCFEDLIASHFDTTYVVDFRLYNNFKLQAFIDENNEITDILFLLSEPVSYLYDYIEALE